MRYSAWICIISACILVFAGTTGDTRLAGAGMQQAMSQPQVQSVLNEYCVTCHNQRQKTASLELDTKDLAHLDADVTTWETVVRKLRTGMMPPKSMRRPDRATLDGVASWLETGLDRAAALHPNPGAPALQRMNRTCKCDPRSAGPSG
jgi:mono/diheme cytochrome c family protein